MIDYQNPQSFIYPNPSNGNLNFSKTLTNQKIEVFSISGQKVYEIEVNNTNFIRLDLESGIYFLRLVNNDQLFNSKIIIE